MTAAQKKRLETYQPGLTIRFEKDYRSLSAHRGDTAQVERVLSDAMMALRRYPPHDVATKAERERLVRWRRGGPRGGARGASSIYRHGFRAGYRNREQGIVEEISAEALSIRRTDGSNLKLCRDQALSLDYTYAVTGHSAQGLDASRVIFEKDTHSPTTDRRSFYTDLTRARDTAVVVTDSSARLAQLVHSDRTQLVALDVVGSSGITFER